MPGLLWKRIIAIVLCSLISVDIVANVKGTTGARTDISVSSKKILQKEGFRFFKKEPSIVTSVIVRIYEQGKFLGFLLVDRGRPPLGPALPGGIVRYKESPENCVKRTLFDECGITSIANVQQLHVYSEPTRDPRMHAVDITYSVRIDDQKISGGTDAKHAWICPLDKIPWDKLVFDHKVMLKNYLDSLISAHDRIERTEKIQPGSAPKNGVRNKNDFENAAKQAYRPPHLFVAGIIEVYENNNFQGIAIADFQKENNMKLLPAGGVAYGETIEQSFQRHMKERFHADVSILNQFNAYSFYNDAGKKHDITTVLLAKADKKALGNLHVYPLDKIPLENLGFHHRNIVEDFLKDRKIEKVDAPAVSVPVSEETPAKDESVKESRDNEI